MSASNPSFAALLATSRTELHAIVPETDTPDLAAPITAFAALAALTRCRLRMRRRSNVLITTIDCRPAPCASPEARSLLDLAEAAVAQCFAHPNEILAFPLDQWIERHGFLPLVTALVRVNVPFDRIEALTKYIADHVRALCERFQFLGSRHRRAIGRRDLGDLPHIPGHSFGPVMHWALAPEFAGKSEREQALLRRRQALDAYGAIASVLLEPEVSQTIDEGQPLNRCLSSRLGVDEARLRRLRGLRPAEVALTERSDFMIAVNTLLLHEVPLHQWPTDSDWTKSVWQDRFVNQVLRPDYIADSTQRRDAFEAVKDDLLEPLAGHRAAMLGLDAHNQVRYFVYRLAVPSSIAHTEQHRLWLRAVREAVIGPRGIKSFDEATKRWHRRAATIAALRHEEQAEAPGWPALCPPWQSADGAYAIHALTSADDLVAEGNALDHCVGGYYSQCRTGGTQILSLREGDQRRATLELFIEPGQGGGLSIKLGQFKTYGDARPGYDEHEILRAFLADLRAGHHPVSAQKIRAYRRNMARMSDYAWSRGPLPIDHARRTWPLYRTFLPKGVPESYDAWCETSGLNAAFDAILTAIAASSK